MKYNCVRIKPLNAVFCTSNVFNDFLCQCPIRRIENLYQNRVVRSKMFFAVLNYAAVCGHFEVADCGWFCVASKTLIWCCRNNPWGVVVF